MFETKNSYRVNGNRGKGIGRRSDSRRREEARAHAVLGGLRPERGISSKEAPGRVANSSPRDVLQRLEREFPKLKTVRTILSMLEEAKDDKVAKVLEWNGYPGRKSDE